jgi:hypothetical protein
LVKSTTLQPPPSANRSAPTFAPDDAAAWLAR